MKFLKIAVCIGIVILPAACEVEDKGIPAYIHVPYIVLETNQVREGSDDDSGIRDVWLSANGDVRGGYELPATIPILSDGNTSLELRGGVFANGMSDARSRYPFFAAFDTTIYLTPGEVDTLIPVIKYSEYSEFIWMENFSNPNNLSLRATSVSTTDNYEVTQDPDEVFEGNGSLKGTIGPGEVLELASNEEYTFSARGDNRLFLELHFKTDVQISVGIYTDNEAFEHMIIHSRDEWRKIYISLTDIVATTTRDGRFRIFIGAGNNSDVEKVFFLDNIKLLRFE